MASANVDEQWQSDKSSSECNAHMLDNELCTDVTLVVSNVQNAEGHPEIKEKRSTIRAHKYVLASRSSVFMSMFYGRMAETKKEIFINDVDPDAFQKALRFMYTDEIELNADLVMFVWYIAKKYMLNTLSKKCTEFLQSQLSAANAAILLDQSLFFDDGDMTKKSLRKIWRDPSTSLMAGSFSEIRQSTLDRILDLKQIKVQEIEVFQACKKWAARRCETENIEICGANMRRILGKSLEKIRFPLLPVQLFNSEVVESEILPPADENKLFRYLSPGSTKQKQDIPYSYETRFTPPGQMQLYDQMKDVERVELASNVATTIELDIDEGINLQGLYFSDFATLPNGQSQNNADAAVTVLLNGRYMGQMLNNSQTVSTSPDIKQLEYPFGYLNKGIHQITLHICQGICTTCRQPNNNLNNSNMYQCGNIIECDAPLNHTGNAVEFGQNSFMFEGEFGYVNNGIHQIDLHNRQGICTTCGQSNNNLNNSYMYHCGNFYQCGASLSYTGNAVGFKQESIKLEDDYVDVVVRNRHNPYMPICGILYTV